MLAEFLGGAGISAAGNLIGAGISAATTAKQNALDREWNANQAELSRQFNASEAEKARQFNSAEAVAARDFNASEAEKARAWQTEMSNTAYQRAFADMKAAGLNPALAFGASPSYSGASASGGAASGGAASGSAAHLQGRDYSQSAKLLASGFGAIGDYFTQRAEAMTARQTMLDMFEQKKFLQNMTSRDRKEFESFKKTLGHVVRQYHDDSASRMSKAFERYNKEL